MSEILVDENVMAGMLGLSKSFLQKDRVTSKRIPFVKIGNCVRYSPEVVKAAVSALQQGGDATSRQKARVKP